MKPCFSPSADGGETFANVRGKAPQGKALRDRGGADMAQIEKYNLRQAIAIICHCERTAATHSNKSIDVEKTPDNYSLWPIGNPDQMKFDTEIKGQNSCRAAYQRLKQRLSEVVHLNRSDVNVLCDWCIHLGVDVPPGFESQRQFFEACVKHICNLYGKKNVVYAWVHMDEETPHIHVGFVPVVVKPLKVRKNASEAKLKEYEAMKAAGKTAIEVVDANSLISQKHLQGWHGGFSNYMKQELGYDPAVYTGVTKALGGNLSVKQLKAKPKGWREKRNLQAEKFHEVRKARKTGKQAGLAALIGVADQNEKIQSETGIIKPTLTRQQDGNLNDLIAGARGGQDER